MPSIDISDIERLRGLLKSAERIALVSHANPDGDAVGSMLGFYHVLPSLGVKKEAVCTLMLPNAVPLNLTFLPGADGILNAEQRLEDCKRALAAADLVLCLDFNTPSRIEALTEALTGSAAAKVLIDHHQCPDREAFDIVFSQPDISSASELAFWVAKALNPECLNAKAATCFYSGMCTDTGSFAFSNEQPSLYEAVAQTIAFDIHPTEIQDNIFNSNRCNQMRFLGFCISQRLRIFEEQGFAYFYVSQADQDLFGVLPYELDGIVNYAMKMSCVRVGAFVKESGGKVRISFRSKGPLDVNSFARRHFGGGGHIKASGATSQYSFDETIRIVEETLKRELSK